MQDIIIAVISCVFGSSFIGILVSVYVRRIFTRIDTLETTVTRLKDEQIAGIDKRLESHISNDKTTMHTQRFETLSKLEIDLKEHIKNDCSQELLANMKTMCGMQSKMDDKLDRITEDFPRDLAEVKAESRSEISSNRRFIENLNLSLQHHKQNHHNG